MAKDKFALGLKPRTGHAVIVALRGPSHAPEIAGKTRIDVAVTFEEGAVYHAAQERPLEQAQVLVRTAESRFTQLAREGLVAFIGALEGRVIAAAMVAPPAKRLPPLETILKAHPMVHAAEGELYRQVFSEACAALTHKPARVAEAGLARSVASALGMSQPEVEAHLAIMGKASGKPWTVHQKQSALAAWLALANLG